MQHNKIIKLKNNKSLSKVIITGPQWGRQVQTVWRKETYTYHPRENMKDTCTFKSKHQDEIGKIYKKYTCN